MNLPVSNPGPVKCETSKRKTSACLGCLDTREKLYDLFGTNLDEAFKELTGLQVSGGQLCYICIHLLQRFCKFRVRCLNSSRILQKLETSSEDVQSIDRTKLRHAIAATHVLTLNYDPCRKNYKKSKNKRTKCAQNETIIFPDDEIKEEFPNIEEFIIKSKIEQAFVELLNETSQNNDDFELNNDDIEHNNDSEINIENIEVANANKNDDDFSWPDNKTDLFSKNLAILDVTDNQNKDENDDQNFDQEMETKETCKEEVEIKHSTENDYNMEGTKSNEEIERMNEHSMVKHEISRLFTKLRKQVKKNGGSGNYYDMFESIYKESLVHTSDFDEDSYNKDEMSDKKLIWEFLSQYKRMEEIGSLKIEFFSVEKQIRETEEKRRSGQYEDGYCNLCIRKFNHKETLQRHVSLKHNQKLEFECKVCLYRFQTKIMLLQHVLTQHNQRVTCNQCGVYFPQLNWYTLQEHKNIHEGKKFTCEFCERTFKLNKLRLMHIRACHRNKIDVVTCLLCGDTYNGPTGLRNHITRIHREAVKCKKCTVYFANADALATHRKGDGCINGQSSCSVCGANFTTKQLMMQHYYKQCSYFGPKKKLKRPCYSKNKNYPQKKYDQSKYRQNLMCEMCGKSGFRNSAILAYHQRIHTGEKPYKCEFCDKTFRMGAPLKVHMAIHTDERRYQCQFCPAAFRQIAHLKSHVTGHTKEKAYSCDICTKTFQHRTSMLEHKRMIHEGLPSKYRKPRVKANNK